MSDELADAKAATAAVHVPGPKRMVGRQIIGHQCLGCGDPWPCKHSWQARAEAAEARLEEIAQLITSFPRHRVCGPDALDLVEGIRQIVERRPVS